MGVDLEPRAETKPGRRLGRVALGVLAAGVAIGGLVVIGARLRRAHLF